MKYLKRFLCVGAVAAMVLSMAFMTSCQPKKVIYSNDQRIEFPVEESVTLTWWYAYDDTYFTGDFKTLDEHPFMKDMEKKTNVKIEFVQPTSNDHKGELMMLMAGGDMCDMVTHAWYTPDYEGNTIDSVIEEEIYRCLNNDNGEDYITVQMENFNSFRETYAEIDKIILTAQNNIMWIPKINHLDDYLQPKSTGGLVIRKDYLDELQMDVPVTIADWEEVLAGFQQGLGIQYPIAVGSMGAAPTITSDVFVTCYNVKYETYRDPETGDVAYGATSDEFYNYVVMMRKWIQNGWAGMVDVNSENKVTDLYVGAWYGSADEVENLKNQATDPDFEIVGAPDPVVNEGDKIVMRDSYLPVGCAALDSVFVSYTCENGALVCRWMDEFFTEESYMRTSYGVEGEDYTVDADGNITFTDKIKNTKDANGNADIRYGIYQNAFVDSFFTDPYVLIDYVYGENTLDAIAQWSKSSMEYSFIDRLCLTYTAEEAEALEGLNAFWGIQMGYAKQMVTGERPLEDWGEYVASMNESGLVEYVAILQSAWDRFLAA